MATFAVSLIAVGAYAAENPMVGGAAMTPKKDIIDNAVNSKDHTTLVAAVKAAGLVETLKGNGPFTVFAPTNEAFEKLPAGTVDTLLKPENKEKLTSILTYHVVAGDYTAKKLAKAIKEGNGEALRHLYKKYYPIILRLITQNSGDEEDAEDIYQSKRDRRNILY